MEKGEAMYMDGKGIIKRTNDLNEALWEKVLPAIFGVSAGLCLALGVMFWRFVVYPPRLVIKYAFDGKEVWSFRDRLIDGPPAPEMSGTADFWCIVLVILGIAIAVASNEPWRRARNELRRHREAMEAETARRWRGWADS